MFFRDFAWDLLRPVCAPTTLLGFGEERILWLGWLSLEKWQWLSENSSSRVASSILFLTKVRAIMEWAPVTNSWSSFRFVLLTNFVQGQSSSKLSLFQGSLSSSMLTLFELMAFPNMDRMHLHVVVVGAQMHMDFWAWNTWKADCQERFQPVKVLVSERKNMWKNNKQHLLPQHFESVGRGLQWKSLLKDLFCDLCDFRRIHDGQELTEFSTSFAQKMILVLASCFSKRQVYFVACFVPLSLPGKHTYRRHYGRYDGKKQIAAGLPISCGVGLHWHEFHHPFSVWQSLSSGRKALRKGDGWGLIQELQKTTRHIKKHGLADVQILTTCLFRKTNPSMTSVSSTRPVQNFPNALEARAAFVRSARMILQDGKPAKISGRFGNGNLLRLSDLFRDPSREDFVGAQRNRLCLYWQVTIWEMQEQGWGGFLTVWSQCWKQGFKF